MFASSGTARKSAESTRLRRTNCTPASADHATMAAVFIAVPLWIVLLQRHPRLHIERFPAYAPELNPDEQVWNHWKAELANGCPMSVDSLLDELTVLFRRVRRSPALLRSFVLESDLPPLLLS